MTIYFGHYYKILTETTLVNIQQVFPKNKFEGSKSIFITFQWKQKLKITFLSPLIFYVFQFI